VTLTCGVVRYRRRTFVLATACAGAIWASYSFFIGRLGGRAFEDRPWAGLLLALGVAVAISVLVELARRLQPLRRFARFRQAGPGQTSPRESPDAPGRPDPGPRPAPSGRECGG
jgi:membrane protein DedA with SNARE-associated domain